MDILTAKTLRNGEELYHVTAKNADGTAQRFKVTSVKTWVRSPQKVRIRLKRGLYQYEEVTESEIHLLTNEEPKNG